jgi:hypothetical protein
LEVRINRERGLCSGVQNWYNLRGGARRWCMQRGRGLRREIKKR